MDDIICHQITPVMLQVNTLACNKDYLCFANNDRFTPKNEPLIYLELKEIYLTWRQAIMQGSNVEFCRNFVAAPCNGKILHQHKKGNI